MVVSGWSTTLAPTGFDHGGSNFDISGLIKTRNLVYDSSKAFGIFFQIDIHTYSPSSFFESETSLLTKSIFFQIFSDIYNFDIDF